MFASDHMKYETKGTGVIIVWREKFLFVVGKEEYWNKAISPPVITYTNTGGHVNPTETVLNATRREVREELGCEIELLSSTTSLCCELESSTIDSYHLDDEVAPILVYNSSGLKMSVCVYLARISVIPHPSTEVPALLLLPVNLLRGGQLKGLLHNGAVLIEQQEGTIPRDAHFSQCGSARILGDHWDQFTQSEQFRNFIKIV